MRQNTPRAFGRAIESAVRTHPGAPPLACPRESASYRGVPRRWIDNAPASRARLDRVALFAAAPFFALGVALRFRIANWPLEKLVSTFVADDAFYYTEIARHIVAGHGPTFDGVNLTNGFHPLWMLFSVVAQYAAGPDPERVLRVLLYGAAVCAAIAGVLLWFLARRVVAPESALAPAALMAVWGLNANIAGAEMMGVEAPLALVFVLLATFRHAALRDAMTPRRAAGIGAIAGLAFLARTDAGVFALLLGVAVFIDARRAASAAGDVKATGAVWFRATLAYGTTFVLVAAPWFAWNLARFGTIWQDSGRVLLARERAIFADSGMTLLSHLASAARRGFENEFAGVYGGISSTAAFAIVAMMAILVIAMRLSGRRAPGGLPGPLVAFGAFVWFFYVLYFWQQKAWYFLPVHAVAALFAARGGAYIEVVSARRESAPWRAGLAAGVPALAVALLYIPAQRSVLAQGIHPWQSVYLKVSRDIAGGRVAGLSADAVLGAFNAGIHGAFSGRRVVNLDGVVNPHIIGAMRERRFMQYVREAGVDVIVDHRNLILTYEIFSAPGALAPLRRLAAYESGTPAGDVLVLAVPPLDAP
ncbi:glycosyltransferase family 39 protein [bacterium]|nr:glycosyltransferase family 39 protein [bacterium]